MSQNAAPIGLYLKLVMLTTLVSCSPKDNAASTDQSATAAAGTQSPPSVSVSSPCPPATEVGTMFGFDVRALTGKQYGDQLVCGYVDAKDEGGATITATASPASEADTELDKIRSNVSTARPGAQTEKIPVGDRGEAYGSSSTSEAAAVSSGRFYHVKLVTNAGNVGDKKDAAIAMLKRMIGG